MACCWHAGIYLLLNAMRAVCLFNVPQVLQYRGLDPRLKLECGDKLQGLVSTGLLQGDNRAKLVAAGL
jgi:hypothetical protein